MGNDSARTLAKEIADKESLLFIDASHQCTNIAQGRF